jgi:hypothetical protein
MADIDIQRKSGSIWPWILGLLLLGLAIWGIAELLDNDEEAVVSPVVTEPVAAPVTPEAVVVAPVAPAPAAAGMIPVATILANPAEWAGRTTSGQARVAEVVSDRGFWIEDGGQRLFVVKDESPLPGVADTQGAADTMASRNVTAGEMLQMSGTVRTSADQLQGPLDAQTRQIIAAQPVFLSTGVSQIQHMSGGT